MNTTPRIRMQSLIPVGSTHRVYKDADKHVFVDGAADWQYFLQFSHGFDRIGYYRLYDRAGRLLGENLSVDQVKKRVGELAAG